VYARRVPETSRSGRTRCGAAGAAAPDARRARLLALLAAHRPLDAAETANLVAIRELVAGEPRCFARDCYRPGHLTGSAFVVDRRGRVLLHHHRRLDRWLQLGGHDEGEHDLAATAQREGAEESGLDDLSPLSPAILDVDVHPIPASRREPAHLHFDVRFAFATGRPGSTRIDPAESHDLAWFPLDEAADLMDEPGGRRAIDRLRELGAAQRPPAT